MIARACVLLLVCAIRAQIVKEFVCQDPDTGTLHGINTTWRSTTFCGNYTCKLRRVTNKPVAKVMVNLFDPIARIPSSKKNQTEGLSFTKILPELSKDNDRLLNTAEIHKITELLHTVKKSDLQAVIELYNVAQEIYKDIKTSENEMNNLDPSGRSNEIKMEDPMETVQNRISYWYEPGHEYRKPALADPKPEKPEYKGQAAYPHRRQYGQPFFYTQNANYPSYFTGAVLSHTDFGRLGYYQPQVNQQIQPSYPQLRNAYDVAGTTQQSACNPCPLAYQYQTPMPANYPQKFASATHQYPPPFYNLTSHSYNNYYKGNPWAYYDYYKNLPYQAVPQAQRNPYPEVVEKVEGDENKVNAENKDDSWKTDPLTEEVINEIRANIAQRGKLLNIPLKKRIKLERAAKVIKLDQFNRKTRSIPEKLEAEEKSSKEITTNTETNKEEQNTLENTEMLEAYIEKVTCEPPTELGYFKMGNLTKPFPDCCPQKIDKQR